MTSGAGHAKLVYCCNSCCGLCNTVEDLHHHINGCEGDPSKSTCDLIAISKEWYMKYVFPWVKLPSIGNFALAPTGSSHRCTETLKRTTAIVATNASVQKKKCNETGVHEKRTVCLSVAEETGRTKPNKRRAADSQNKHSEDALCSVPNYKQASDSVIAEDNTEESLRKKLKSNLVTEAAIASVPNSIENGSRSSRTRRKAAVNYRLLNDGVGDNPSKNCVKRKFVKNTVPVVTVQNVMEKASEKENCNDNDIDKITETATVPTGLNEETTQADKGNDNEDAEQGELNHKETYKMCKKYVKVENGNRVMYHCPMCPKKTPFIGFFRRHMETFHNDGNGFICEVCTEKCSNSTQYRLHINKHVKPFMCEECSCSFAQKKDLLVHLKIHSGEFSYFCEHCDYKCRQMKSLKEHMRLHDGKVLQCSHEGCEYQTIYAFALRSHVLSKHTEKSLHQCAQCDFKTNDHGCFNRHMKIHLGIKNYKCGMCEYKGRTKYDVVRHMSVHTGEKRYQCPGCPYSTSHGAALRSHLLKHMGIHAWRCNACKFVGSQRHHVVRHASRKHSAENAEDYVLKSDVQVRVDLAEFKTWENDSYNAANEELLQLENGIDEDVEAVTHIIFQDPDNPDGDQIMTIATEDLEDDQNVTIMTIDADALEGQEDAFETSGQIMRFAAENDEVMIVTETYPEIQNIMPDSHTTMYASNQLEHASESVETEMQPVHEVVIMGEAVR